MKTNLQDELVGLEGFVEELRRLEAPQALERTIAPVVAASHSRRSGARIRIGWQLGAAIAGLAAMVAVYVGRPVSVSSDGAHAVANSSSSAIGGAAPSSTRDAGNTLAAFLSPWPAYAQAQTPGRGMAAPYPPLTALDPSRLRAGKRSYVRLSANDYHASLPHEAWATTLDTVRYRGVLTWRLVRRIDRTNNAGAESGEYDTLWLRANDLRPLARNVHVSSIIASAQSFTDSSVVSADSVLLPKGSGPPPRITAWTQRRSYRPSSPYVVSSDMLRVLLRAAPLNETWRASVQVEAQYNAATPNRSGYVNLRVAGVDTVQLLGGRFPCWRVTIETGAAPESWCVSQETGETLVTDGPYDASYPESRSIMLYGLQETKRAPPVRRR